MTDEGFIHVSYSNFVPQEHAPDCSDPKAQPESGYGLAGGGMGGYSFCPNCFAVLSKTEDHEDD